MCECGCSMNNESYKLPGGKGFCYVIDIYPGCRNCVAPPGLIVRRVTPDHCYWEDARHLPDLPEMLVDGHKEYTIKCGLDPDEFAKKFCEQAKVGQFGKAVTDAAYDLAELVWDEAVGGQVEAVEAKD